MTQPDRRPTIVRFSAIVFGGLVRIYPRRFRSSLGADLRSTLEARITSAHRETGIRGAIAAIGRNAGLLLRDAIAERARTVMSHHDHVKPAARNPIRSVLQDTRWAWRSLAKAPLFSAFIVVVLAAAVGTSTAVFSVVNSVLFRPLPFNAADKLSVVCETNPMVEGFCTTSFVNVRDWDERTRSFAAISAARGWPFQLKQGELNESVTTVLADDKIFTVFQFVPALGRFFFRGDPPNVAVLTHPAWEEWFAGDSAAIGSALSLGGELYEVIGVLPPNALLPGLESGRVWLPIPFPASDIENREWRGFSAYARLRDEADPDVARQELYSVAAELADIYPQTNREWGIRTESLQQYVVGETRETLIVFLGAIVFVLLIAGTNVANLVLVRWARRTKELAVRSAIGAGPTRVRRMLLIESLILSATAGTAALVIASVGVDAFIQVAPPNIPRLNEVALNGWAILFLIVVSTLCAVVISLAPARMASKMSITAALRGVSAVRSRNVSRRGFWTIGGQVALTSTLLIGAGLLMRSFLAFTAWNPGFDADHLTAFWALAEANKYEDGFQVVATFNTTAQEIRALPGVQSVSMASAGPLFGGRETESVTAADAPDRDVVARWFDIGNTYFETMRQPLLAGRSFDDRDNRSAQRVVIVNAALAERLWPSSDPIGKQVRLTTFNRTLEVVGVAANTAPFNPGEPPEPSMFWPNQQQPRWATYFIVRSELPAEALVSSIRSVVKRVDPDMGASRFSTVDELMASRLTQPRFNMLLIGSFAGCAILLAAAGIFGIISYSVSGRAKEMGVRKSLGATRARILLRVVWEGLLPAVIGIVIGIIGALTLGGVLQGVIAGVSPQDPATLFGTAILMTVITVCACVIPARRASRTDPNLVLRAE